MENSKKRRENRSLTDDEIEHFKGAGAPVLPVYKDPLDFFRKSEKPEDKAFVDCIEELRSLIAEEKKEIEDWKKRIELGLWS